MIWFFFISNIFIPRSQSKRNCITSLACCPDWQSSGVKRSDVIMLLRPLSCSARTCSFSNNSFLLLWGSTKYNNDDGSKEMFALEMLWVFASDLTSHKSKTKFQVNISTMATLGTEKSGHCREVAVSGGLTEIQPTVCLREMSILLRVLKESLETTLSLTLLPPPYLWVWMTGQPSPPPPLSQGLDSALQEARLRSGTIRKDLPVCKRHTHPPIPPL